LTNLRAYTSSSTPVRIADSAGAPYYWVSWIPDTVRPAANVTQHWILFTGGADIPGAKAPYLARKKAVDGSPVFPISRSNPIQPKT